MDIQCILWDFGDTLADEKFLLTSPQHIPEWGEVWREVLWDTPELTNAWDTGEISTQEIAAIIAQQLERPIEEVLTHMQQCCKNLQFFDMPWLAAKRCTLPRAMITIMPDAFSKWTVPYYQLDEIFFPLVTSWEEHILDKGIMSLIALERLDHKVEPEQALLIDNRQENLDAWAIHGGPGYLFTSEVQFQQDLTTTLNMLA
ncbi:MAG: hypothetical protein AAF512_04380 [Pseudomonadota bacterium]